MIKKYVISGVPDSEKTQLMNFFSEKHSDKLYLMQNVAGDMDFGGRKVDNFSEKEMEKIRNKASTKF